MEGVFYWLGVIPEDLREDAMVTVGGPKIRITIPCSNTLEMRERLLRWFEDEFFSYEEEPYTVGDVTDVATLRAALLPKPIVVTVSMRENI